MKARYRSIRHDWFEIFQRDFCGSSFLRLQNYDTCSTCCYYALMILQQRIQRSSYVHSCAAADLHSGNSSMRSVVSCRVATITPDDRSQARSVFTCMCMRVRSRTRGKLLCVPTMSTVFLVEPTFFFLYP